MDRFSVDLWKHVECPATFIAKQPIVCVTHDVAGVVCMPQVPMEGASVCVEGTGAPQVDLVGQLPSSCMVILCLPMCPTGFKHLGVKCTGTTLCGPLKMSAPTDTTPAMLRGRSASTHPMALSASASKAMPSAATAAVLELVVLAMGTRCVSLSVPKDVIRASVCDQMSASATLVTLGSTAPYSATAMVTAIVPALTTWMFAQSATTTRRALSVATVSLSTWVTLPREAAVCHALNTATSIQISVSRRDNWISTSLLATFHLLNSWSLSSRLSMVPWS